MIIIIMILILLLLLIIIIIIMILLLLLIIIIIIITDSHDLPPMIHSYVTYGPLLNGATQVVFEGVPSFPDAGRLWHVVDKYKVRPTKVTNRLLN
jgi:hypothetical protein